MSGNKLKNSKRIFSQDGSTASTDTRIYNLENNVYKVTYYEIISGASGTLSVPSQATINQDEFGLSGNALLSKINANNKPTYESPSTLSGTFVTASLNTTTGDWAVSGAYTDLYVALIYSIDIKAEYFSNLDNFYIIETTNLSPKGSQNLQDVTDIGNITNHPIEANSFIKTGGNSNEFLKADGSSDNNTYLTTAVTSVSATAPLTSTGGNTPDISTSMNTNKLIGRSTTGVGIMEEITIGTGLSLSAGTLNSSSIGDNIYHGISSGTDTYTVAISGPTAYNDGDSYLIRFTNGNTTSATLNINGLGAIPLYRNNDGPLLGGDVSDNGEMLCIYNSTLNNFQVIGISPNSLIAYITNADSVTLTKGMVVYAFSGVGDRLTVKRANNVGDSTSAQTIGLVLSTSIGVNQKGLIMMQGLLDGLSILPTATWADGDPVYLGATDGTITKIKPHAPNHLVYLGFVTTASNGSAGRLYVRVQNGYELDELHNVQAQSPTLKDTLWYDNTVSPAQWKTASINTILGYTPEDIANKAINYTTINNTLYPTLQATEDRYALKESQLNSGGSITIGTFGGSGTNNDIRVSAANWYIQSTALNYFTSGNTDFLDIVPAVIGEQRYIGFYGTTSNTIIKVEGNEDILATFPTQPVDTALIGYVLVTDAGAGTTPDLSGYLLKSSKATQATNVTGTNDITYVTPLANAVKENVNRKSSSFTVSSTTTYANTKALVDGLATKVTKNANITADTKTKITYDAKGLVTNGTDATTADIADSLNKRYVTDFNLTTLNNTSGVNTGDETNATIKTKLGTSSSLTDGYLTSTDWNTFNNKYELPALTNGSILFSNGSTITENNANLFWDDSSNRLGIGTTSPIAPIDFGTLISTAGDVNKIALCLDPTYGVYGLGVSDAQLDYVTGKDHVFYKNNPSPIELFRIDGSGNITSSSLIGSGTRMLVTNALGLISTQVIPVPTFTPSALTKVDDTNIILTLGGTPATALLEAVSIKVDWSGTLADGRITSASTWNSKEPGITLGTTSQYWRGDKTWQTFPSIPSVTPSALTAVDDTNVTLVLGGSPSNALLQAVSLKLGWTGTLDDSRITNAATWNAKQDALNGTGVIKSTAGVISYVEGSGVDFLKGDGSLDGNTYLTTSNAASTYVELAGDQMTGPLTFSGTTHAGIKLNNLTTAQRLALTPSSGMLILDTDLDEFCHYNGAGWEYELNKSVTGAATTTSNSASNITGLSFPLEANSTFLVDGYYSVSCSGTGGLKFTASLPTLAVMDILYDGLVSLNTSSMKVRTLASGILTTTAVNTVASNSGVIVKGFVRTTTSAGTLQMQFASGTNGQTSTIAGNSYIKITRIA